MLSTEQQEINRQWTDACAIALDACPTEFVARFTEIMFLGNRLITEARISAEIDSAKDEIMRRFGLNA